MTYKIYYISQNNASPLWIALRKVLAPRSSEGAKFKFSPTSPRLRRTPLRKIMLMILVYPFSFLCAVRRVAPKERSGGPTGSRPRLSSRRRASRAGHRLTKFFAKNFAPAFDSSREANNCFALGGPTGSRTPTSSMPWRRLPLYYRPKIF